MKEVTKYVANDGVEFLTAKECLSHEAYMEYIANHVNAHKDDPSEALITLMKEVQTVLDIRLSYDNYVAIFRNHKPCAFACSLWRILADYANDYPTVFSLYTEYMTKYVELYGEKVLN